MAILRKISALMMATFILLTTTGFALHKHHCTVSKKTIISVTHVKGCCGTEEKEQDCPKGCCQDETQYIQLSSELTLPATVHEISPEQFVAVVQYCVLNSFFNQEVETSVKYFNYKPPLPDREIFILVQSFLL